MQAGKAPIVDFTPSSGKNGAISPGPAMPLSQLSTPLTQEQAYRLVDAVMERGDLALAASAHEEADGVWVFEATAAGAPDLEAFTGLAREILGGVLDFAVEPIDTGADWVAKSLEGLRPVTAGGFFIHGSHEADSVPPGPIPIEIDAAQAFGTGHHETTIGCLEALSAILKRRRPADPLDIGTGTGILAIAIAKRRHVRVVATDIDPVATRIAEANARRNGVGNEIVTLAAPGLAHRTIAAHAPYDLIVANILAGPLVKLAPAIARAAAPRAEVVLSGLLVGQAARVLAAYRAHGMVLARRIVRGKWETLVLARR